MDISGAEMCLTAEVSIVWLLLGSLLAVLRAAPYIGEIVNSATGNEGEAMWTPNKNESQRE